jgi:hypothetical protein
VFSGRTESLLLFHLRRLRQFLGLRHLVSPDSQNRPSRRPLPDAVQNGPAVNQAFLQGSGGSKSVLVGSSFFPPLSFFLGLVAFTFFAISLSLSVTPLRTILPTGQERAFGPN